MANRRTRTLPATAPAPTTPGPEPTEPAPTEPAPKPIAPGAQQADEAPTGVDAPTEDPTVEPTPEPTFESADLAEPSATVADLTEPAEPTEWTDAVDELFRRPDPERAGPRFAFATRLTFALIAAAVLPLSLFGLLLVLAQRLPDSASATPRLLLLAIIVTALISSLAAYILVADLTAPLRAIAAAVDRAKAGDLTTPIDLPGDDELARLAESHNRLAADLERRNRELGRILGAIVHSTPRQGLDWLMGRAGADAREVFGFIDAEVRLVDPATVRLEERVPGEPRPVRADLRAGDERIGVLLGHAPVMRTWERADQDLLEVFAAQVGVAVRNAQLFATVEAQNAQLLELDAAKDDFLRGVSHNLQTPLTSIRAYAEQLADRPGPAPGDHRRAGRPPLADGPPAADRHPPRIRRPPPHGRGRLARIPGPQGVGGARGRGHPVRTRRPEPRLAGGGRCRPARPGAVGAARQRREIRRSGPGRRRVGLTDGRLRLTIADHGPGVAETDRGRLFGRFERGSTQNAEDGSGLGLYVARELARAMGGDLVLEPTATDRGAAFTVWLPAEVPLEG